MDDCDDIKSELVSETGCTELSVIKDKRVRTESKMDKFIGAATGNQCCNECIIRIPACCSILVIISIATAFALNELSTYDTVIEGEEVSIKCELLSLESCNIATNECTLTSYKDLCSQQSDSCNEQNVAIIWIVCVAMGIVFSLISAIWICYDPRWKIVSLLLSVLAWIVCLVAIIEFTQVNNGHSCWNIADNKNMKLGQSNILLVVAICLSFIGTIFLSLWYCCCSVFYNKHHSVLYHELDE